MAFRHNSKVADNEPMWGTVDKTALPRIAFADMGEEGKKSTWGYPHHWVKGGTEKDENGIWKDGELYLHQGGLRAAWAAAMGARSGQKASDEVIAHLKQHRKALGWDDEEDEREKSGITGERLFYMQLFSRGEWAIDGAYLQASLYLIPKQFNASILSLEDGYAVIKIRDILTAEDEAAGTSYSSIRDAIEKAVQNGAEHIYLDIDSPGGEVRGLFGLLSYIDAVREGGVKFTALVNEHAYSAAYAIAAATGNVVMAKSGGVGSIGVITAHVDMSAYDAMQGIKWTMVSAGKYKDILNPHRPVTEEDIAYMRGRVEGIYNLLVGKIASYRNLHEDQIRDLGASLLHYDKAADAGLVDVIVDDVYSVIPRKLARPREETQKVITQAIAEERERCLQILNAWEGVRDKGVNVETLKEQISSGVAIQEAMKHFLDKVAEWSNKDQVNGLINSAGYNPLLAEVERLKKQYERRK
ncbi:MAG: S49 family peptidase [Nitrososphaerota archaeon]